MVAMKRCSRCKQEHDATLKYFGRLSRIADGLDYYCRTCRREIQWQSRAIKSPKLTSGIKQCAICKKELPANVEFFAPHRRNRDNLDSCCFSCRRDIGRRTGTMKKTERHWIQVEIGMKWCATCKAQFPATLEYFPPRKDSKDGLSGRCRTCSNEASRIHTQNHPERVRAAKKRYDDTHKEKKREQERKRLEENPEAERYSRKVNALNRLKANPDRERQKQRDAIHRYRQKHPNRVLLLNDRRRLRKLNLPSTFAEDDWHTAHTYWQSRCVYCGCVETENKKLVMDHYIPLSHPECPGTIATNILPCCRSCNSRKNNREALSWLIANFEEGYAIARFELIQAYFQWLSYKATSD